ncbi:MAG: hypothetical protein JWO19_3977 [Bryobacterales bacterium]|nr:hypothetical protein [Bryobacterales bacterium]
MEWSPLTSFYGAKFLTSRQTLETPSNRTIWMPECGGAGYSSAQLSQRDGDRAKRNGMVLVRFVGVGWIGELRSPATNPA